MFNEKVENKIVLWRGVSWYGSKISKFTSYEFIFKTFVVYVQSDNMIDVINISNKVNDFIKSTREKESNLSVLREGKEYLLFSQNVSIKNRLGSGKEYIYYKELYYSYDKNQTFFLTDIYLIDDFLLFLVDGIFVILQYESYESLPIVDINFILDIFIKKNDFNFFCKGSIDKIFMDIVSN